MDVKRHFNGGVCSSDAQADPSLRRAHMAFYWFCHEVAHLLTFVKIVLTVTILILFTVIDVNRHRRVKLKLIRIF